MKYAQRIDELFSLKQARLAAQKDVDAMKEEEDSLLAALTQEMIENGDEVEAGTRGRLTIKVKEEPEVTNWNELYDHIKKTGEVDLLQKRPMVSAIKARWEEGTSVPGVTKLEVQYAVLGKV